MSEAPDPLESEMAALRPCEPSPALRQQIAERFADSTLGKRRRPWWVALVGGLAAACVGVLILLRAGTSRRVEPERIVIQRQAAPAPEIEASRPTLQAYRLALCARPKIWMPCSTSMPWLPRNQTRRSRASALARGPKPNFKL